MTERPHLRLLRALDAAQVEYAIAGGFAVVLHGVPRMTFDLDIVVDDADSNMQRTTMSDGRRTLPGSQPPADQIARFAKVSPQERFHWLVDTLALLYELATPETRAAWRKHKS